MRQYNVNPIIGIISALLGCGMLVAGALFLIVGLIALWLMLTGQVDYAQSILDAVLIVRPE